MADGVTVRTNIPDFRRQLAQLSDRVERKIATRAVRAAGGVFRTAARQLAPILKQPTPRRVAGALRRAIYVGRSRDSRKGSLVYFVGVRAAKGKTVATGRDPFFWRFLEGGWIPRGRGQKFRGGTRSRALQRKRAVAMGARRISYPFLQPAFEKSKVQALAAFTAKMEEGLAQELANER